MLIRNPRALLAFSHDVAVAAIAWYAGYLLRFNFDIPAPFVQSMLQTMVWVVPIQAIVFWRLGLYRGIWRYASLPDIKQILSAIAIATLLAPLILLMLRLPVVVPRSVLVLDPILLTLLMAGSRLIYRAWKEHRLYGVLNLKGAPVLVLGAGDGASTLLKELARSHEWRVVGLLDDNAAKQERYIQGVKVLGRLDDLPRLAGALKVANAIIAMPAASPATRRRAVQICSDAGVKTMTVPTFDDLISGKVTISQVRQVQLDDLLGRDPVSLDDEGLHGLLTNQIIMISGAGGSIGSELCRQIAKFKPRQLVLYEMNEFALYQMEQELSQAFPGLPIVCAIGDVKNTVRLNQIMSRYPPHVIFHAAAYKHVPLMEQENAWEAVLNNVLGTHCIASAAVEHGVEKFVLISTDKAVNPTNVMGASKRLAELVCQSLQQNSQTRFVMVRFGNVLGSTGSVIPKFHEQIAYGGPVTVTHPDITRYFMSISEAAQLVLQAGLMGHGGEIFVMDMGEPVKIADLAKDMIRLSGFSEEEIKIVYTGLRPGEKLYEELLADDEHTLPTPHPKLRIAQAREANGAMAALVVWLDQGQALSDAAVKQAITRWVPEYTASEDSSQELSAAGFLQ